jgi:hypothetical protein
MPEGQVCGQPLGKFQSRNSLGQFKHSHQTCWFCDGHFSRTCRPAESDLHSILSRALRESMPSDVGSLEYWQRSPFQVCQKFEHDPIRESGFRRSYSCDCKAVFTARLPKLLPFPLAQALIFQPVYGHQRADISFKAHSFMVIERPVMSAHIKSRRTCFSTFNFATLHFHLLFAQALIFSQFMGTIDWLKIKLTEAGVKYRYISGDMPLNKRAKAIEQFQQVSSILLCLYRITRECAAILKKEGLHDLRIEALEVLVLQAVDKERGQWLGDSRGLKYSAMRLT